MPLEDIKHTKIAGVRVAIMPLPKQGGYAVLGNDEDITGLNIHVKDKANLFTATTKAVEYLKKHNTTEGQK